MKFKNILVTGAAGFIGYHLSKRLLNEGVKVTGLDMMSQYYDVKLKQDRIETIIDHPNFTFSTIDLRHNEMVYQLFNHNEFDAVVHLAAQAGVRYSLEDPHEYVGTNLYGFLNVLEGCRHHNIKHLLFASSSSVYGANTKIPFSVHDNVDHPLSIYAATKKGSEMMAHSYSNLFDVPCTGVRFFTVYGPWGRPDLSLFIFTKAIIEGKPIQVFNHGNMQRDFTYIDDVVESLIRLIDKVPESVPSWDSDNPDPSYSYAPYKLYNIGNHDPIELNKFIEIIEDTIGKKAEKEYLGMQDGDVQITYADVNDLINDIGYKPSTRIEDGIRNFIDWYKEYYRIGEEHE